MKKIVALMVCLLAMSMAACTDSRPIPFEQLPAATQAFVTAHFPDEKVALAKVDRDWFWKTYDVIFTNGSTLELTGDGDWEEVNCQMSAVPDAIIPPIILLYVQSNYPDLKILKIDKNKRRYKLKLSNRLELKYDHDFNLIDIDD